MAILKTLVVVALAASASALVVKQDHVSHVSLPNVKYNRTVSYQGQQVLRCQTDGTAEVDLERIANDFDMMANSGGFVDVRTKTSAEVDTINKVFAANACTVLIPDMEAAMQEFERDLVNSRTNSQAEWFEAYHTYDEIVGWYSDIADEFPLITKLVPSIGRSFNGLDMPALHITGTATGAKKNVWFQCQIHAREWISGATCMYIVNYLANNYNVDSRVTTLLNEVELIVVPFVNPDGYEYTWSNERLWRKNRSPNADNSCVGTDLNRNYNDHWGEGGSSSNPCSDTYMGTGAASEAETRNINEYFLLNQPIYGSIDWHAYSQLMLRPYGWSRSAAPDEAMSKEIGDKMRDAARAVNGLSYTSQPSVDLYITTGSASDWFYGEEASAGRGSVRSYGFTIELRDTGRFGFQLPASEIIPQGQEMIPAALDFMEFTTQNPLYY